MPTTDNTADDAKLFEVVRDKKGWIKICGQEVEATDDDFEDLQTYVENVMAVPRLSPFIPAMPYEFHESLTREQKDAYYNAFESAMRITKRHAKEAPVGRIFLTCISIEMMRGLLAEYSPAAVTKKIMASPDLPADVKGMALVGALDLVNAGKLDDVQSEQISSMALGYTLDHREELINNFQDRAGCTPEYMRCLKDLLDLAESVRPK